MKYFLDAASYARANATGSIPNNLAPYATVYLEYDVENRVRREDLQGAGGTAGVGTYYFAYTTSGNAPGANSWATKTTETLPDGNQNIVYANAYGEPMLNVYNDSAFGGTGNKWKSFTQYDASGRVSMQAAPSAVNGYDESKPDLLNGQNGSNYSYLNQGAGFVGWSVYSTGYLSIVSISQGEAGAKIMQNNYQYVTHSAGGITIPALSSSTVYRGDGIGGTPTGPEATIYAYSWFDGTNMPQTITVTAPAVTTGENGCGQAAVTTTINDTYGRPIWSQDALGILNFTVYDQATGAATETIADFGGLNLPTQVAVDALGRPTKVTDPNGNSTYTVYDDAAHEVRVYPAAGPVQVTREDRANSYVETLTMAPTTIYTSGGLPLGTEDPAAPSSNLQTLSRTYFNSAGHAYRKDDYFNLPGLTYSTEPLIGAKRQLPHHALRVR